LGEKGYIIYESAIRKIDGKEEINMREEEKIFSGVLFCPGDQELREIKLRTHNLCYEYNRTFEDETEKRQELISKIFNQFEGGFIQGPMYIHYGKHTKIGHHFFGNFNLTIQDDAWVTIGNHCNFGPNVTIVTPVHPMLPDERREMLDKDGAVKRFCYAKPVKIGNDCWFGANVVVCPGVTIGDNCVIGAGSVVVKDIPSNSFAAGNPCRVIRELSEADSMINKPEILGDNRVIK
jgi:maltose O-acetyltransferase